MRGFLAAVVMGVGLAGGAHAEFPAFLTGQVALKYSRGVDPQHRQMLEQDLHFLKTVDFQDNSGLVQHLFKVPAVNTREMSVWLAQRAHFVIDVDHPVQKVAVLKEEVNYPFPDLLPPQYKNESKLLKSAKNPFPFVLKASSPEQEGPQSEADQDDSEAKGRTVMSNIGGGTYMVGKMMRTFIGFPIEGVGIVPLNSPRVGILQVGPALFSLLSPKMAPEMIHGRVHRLFRLSTLFHESRHSDGHAESATFPHVKCPEGHDYAGAYACDEMANGPYRIEAVWMQSVKDGCSDCSAGEKEMITYMQADGDSRVLDFKTEWPDEPEFFRP